MKNFVKSEVFEHVVSAEPMMADASVLMNLVLKTQEIGSWRVDVASGQAFWSKKVYEIHGIPYSEGPVRLDAAIKVYHPTDAKTVAWLVMNAIEQKQGYSFILRLNRADGKTRLVQSAADVELGANGEVVGLYGVFKDVTERFSDLALAESRGQLVRSIISNTPVPLIVLDKQLRYLEISPSWIDYYKLPPRETLIGQMHYEVMPDLPEEFKEDNERALHGHVVHSKYSLGTDDRLISTAKGATIFPWYTRQAEVGGIILMLTTPNEMQNEDRTLSQIAELMMQYHEANKSWNAA